MEEDSQQTGRITLLLKLFGVLCIVGGLMSLVDLIPIGQKFFQGIVDSGFRLASIVIFFSLVLLLVSSAVLFIFLGYCLVCNRRQRAALIANILALLTTLSVVATVMLFGLSVYHIGYLIQFVILIILTSYLDPQLVEERQTQRKLKKMDKKQRAEQKHAARRCKPKKGFITLNFYNLFWIFVVCCMLGLAIETVYHLVAFREYQDRAGLLFGPFSPIYGFGALIMTIALNRFHHKPVWFIFLLSAFLGGAFEFFTSWIMEYAFGICSWDYTGTFLSIDGRTNFSFMMAWGILGLLWIKYLLPYLLKFINLIPWNWRYGTTMICTVLLLLDGIMTLQAIDCWYERMAGKVPSTPIEEFYAEYFNDDYMQNRFQTMMITVENSARADV